MMTKGHKNMTTEEMITYDELVMITKSLARQNPLWQGIDSKDNLTERKILNECFAEPSKQINGRHAYHCIAEQASALFYTMLKQKPFKKHNDRIAVVVLAYVMDRHAQPIGLDEDKLFDYVRWMKLSPEGTKKEVIEAFSRVLE